MKILIVIHVIISIILIAVVLMQNGKQQGLSGAIAGGAETFFGKNKGRTIDALLSKATTVIAVLFVISALALAIVSVKSSDKADATTTVPGIEDAAVVEEGENAEVVVDENGNVVVEDETTDEAAEAETTENSEATETTEDGSAE